MGAEIATVLQLVGYLMTLVGLGITGVFGVRVARENRAARQDRTPSDTNEATRIANDLILRLLDRANADVERYQGLVDAVSEEAKTYKNLAALVPGLTAERDRAIREQDRLRKAIRFLESKARVTGTIAYAEVVAWAQLALDPEADPTIFDVSISDVLPDGLEDTVTTLA